MDMKIALKIAYGEKIVLTLHHALIPGEKKMLQPRHKDL